nr:hypothetical protein [Desulfobulbaceae bacterium]
MLLNVIIDGGGLHKMYLPVNISLSALNFYSHTESHGVLEADFFDEPENIALFSVKKSNCTKSIYLLTIEKS